MKRDHYLLKGIKTEKMKKKPRDFSRFHIFLVLDSFLFFFSYSVLRITIPKLCTPHINKFTIKIEKYHQYFEVMDKSWETISLFTITFMKFLTS